MSFLDRMLRRGPTFEVFKGPSAHWFVRELAPNGRTLSLSESYASRSNAARAARKQADGAKHGRWRYEGGPTFWPHDALPPDEVDQVGDA